MLRRVLQLEPFLKMLGRRVYYPINRSLRPLASRDSKGFLAGWSHQDYNGEFVTKAYKSMLGAETGYNLYSEVRSLVLGGARDRGKLRIYEEFLSAEFFDRRSIALIPYEADPTKLDDPAQYILHIEIDGRNRPIYDLGDGLQQIILLTFRPFMAGLRTEPMVFFIEEPELYLHPGLQRRLVEWYLRNTPHMYFMTTHSNHLLDMTMDQLNIAVFNFSTAASEGDEEMFNVRRVNRADQSSLALLGVRASSVFLVNATIWVEGPTDRKYLRAYFVLLEAAFAPLQQMKEDTHYGFVEYGGALITHWDFGRKTSDERIAVSPICAGAFVLVDNDGDDVKKARKDWLKSMLEAGQRYGETAGREIENMLPAAVVAETVWSLAKAPAKPPQEFSRDHYKNKGLGGWIEKELGPSLPVGHRAFAKPLDEKSKRGRNLGKDRTLHKDVKQDFCNTACEHLRNARWSDLSPDVQTLLLRIYNHIRDMNGLPPLTDPASPSTP